MVLSCSVALWPGRWMPTSITAMQLRIEHGLRLSSYPSTHVVGQFGTPTGFYVSVATMRKPVMMAGSMAMTVSAWLTHGWSSCS